MCRSMSLLHTPVKKLTMLHITYIKCIACVLVQVFFRKPLIIFNELLNSANLTDFYFPRKYCTVSVTSYRKIYQPLLLLGK